MEVMFIYVAADQRGQRNLDWGIETQTWGFRNDEADYHQPVDLVVFGYGHTAGGPRAKGGLPTWSSGDLDLVVSQWSGVVYRSEAPHWQDEIAEGRVIYPWRFGHIPLGAVTDVAAAGTGPLGPEGTEALWMSGLRGGRGQLRTMDAFDILVAADLPGDLSALNLATTAGVPDPEGIQDLRKRRGTGRVNDAAFNQAVEQHAVNLAAEYMKANGWDQIEILGKPYDLVCTSKNKSGEKHVEVKGTTGAGATVDYTPNEIHHFRTCPDGGDLIVVADIVVDITAVPYKTSGGSLRHIRNYSAPPEDLQATAWRGRIPIGS